MAPPGEVSGRASLQTTTSVTSASQLRDDNGIRSLRYEEAMEGKAPISVTVPPPRVSPPRELHPALRNSNSLSADHDSEKRDSALAPQTSSTTASSSGQQRKPAPSVPAKDSNVYSPTTTIATATTIPFQPTQTTKNINHNNAMAEKEDAALAALLSCDAPTRRPSPKLQIPKTVESTTARTEKQMPSTSSPLSPTTATTTEGFSPIATPIPQSNLDFFNNVSFSKRGSMLFDGTKVASSAVHMRRNPTARLPIASMASMVSAKTLTPEVEQESHKIRSLYESDEQPPLDWRDGRLPALGEVDQVDEEGQTEMPVARTPTSPTEVSSPIMTISTHRGSTIKREHELAGGLEDWEDVEGGDVDRYGFISMRDANNTRPGTPEPRPPQRVNTVLHLASQLPRPQRRLLGRAVSTKSAPRKVISRQASARSLKTIDSDAPAARTNLHAIRTAVNRLPGNKDKRCIDEAGDMLTLPPGLADSAEKEEGGKAAEASKTKEWARTEKWRKMAKIVKNGKEGEGMNFEFDIKSSKLIERTWKGIPDRWRATAWFSFLAASAKKNQGSATDEQITDAFRQFVAQSCEDDTQIDLDVPRTINSHIMFRRRYRGGQRLLFRVLHCLSLYFPTTGYCQGMASLAATLLCYYDEEKTFIMLVRMWQYRGLEKIYAMGFKGLTSALDELNGHWLAGTEISKQLTELDIDPTAYGTRWYLTLFNYSIPFASQLRIWDVFMLLGDADPSSITDERPFGGCMDVIHAAGAALLEGTRDIVLDSDFENAMRVLTSFIPVKDEEILLNITKVKYNKFHGKRSRAKTLVKPPSTKAPSTAVTTLTATS